MSRRVRLSIAVAGSLAAIIAGLFLYGKWAIHQVQPFYSAALQVDPDTHISASLEMESRVSALVSDAAEQSHWQAAFSDDEVNGWLASSLTEKFPGLLPEAVSDPRVAFSDGIAALGFRYQDDHLNSVLSLRASAVIDGTDIVALRLLQAHVGTLPFPMAKIVEAITDGARQQQIAIRWTQQDGDPVALIPLTGLLSTPKVERRLDVVEFHEGELYLSGSTRSLPQPMAAEEKSPPILDAKQSP
ncbi:MAG: hypothetical protein GXP26_07670 [Planctomycetes bacterium]|nr:hypothetical protein [Planctomycetota bacterium]